MVLCCLYFCWSLPSNATTESITVDSGVTTTIPEIADLSDGTITNGTCVGGSSHLNLLTSSSEAWSGSPTLQWGACSDTFAMTMAINEVLSDAGTGISLDKIHYRWKWINGCFNITKANGDKVWCSTDIENRLDENMKPTGEYADQFDALNIVIEITDSNGTIIETKTYDYDTWYHWSESNSHSTNETTDGEGAVWQITEDHIELFNHITGTGTIYTPNQLGNISFVANAQDNGQWEGYYGPVARDGEMWFTYRNNPCDLDTLYNPSCSGYAEAYAAHLYDQSCIADSLFDIGCPNYATAYQDQQCKINPLYSVQCPNYQTAYFNQQCDLDPQYDIGCPNYSVPTVMEEIVVTDPVAEIINPNITITETIPEIIMPEIIVPQIDIVSQIAPVEEITTQSIETEIAAIEAEINEQIVETTIVEPESGETSEERENSGNTNGNTTTQETEKPQPEKNDEPKSETDGESEETPNDEQSESKNDGGKEKDVGKDTGSKDGNGKDKEVDESENNNEAIESEEDVVRPQKKEEKEAPTEAEKKNSRKEKIRRLIADKVNSLTKKVEEASTLEEQVAVQAQLAALIAFVPDFDYGDMEVPDIYFYPPVPTVDHAFSRWFVNDPTFGIMEDLQYPSLRQ